MAPAADPPSSPPIPTANGDLQSFFVLHKAASRKPAAKTRRRIDLSPPKNSDGSASAEGCNDNNTRFETFRFLWSNTESIIKDVLKNLNANVFDEIDKWVYASFDAIRACRTLELTSATCNYPILNNALIGAVGASSQIFTALLSTKNIEFVDDISTFAELGAHLTSTGCFVANLTSLDFCAKNGVGGSLKSLLRQFLMVGIDAPEMSILASWYTERETNDKPLVVIIDDVERCSGSVLNNFIVMLREWVVKIPIILILGVATTADVLRNILCSSACLYLSVCEFNLGTPAERMDAIIEAVLLKSCQSFNIGKHASNFLRNYFLKHDGTLTLFVKALKGFDGDNSLLKEPVIKRALKLPSLRRYCQTRGNCIDWTYALSELKRLRQLWSSIVMCLYEVGRYRKIALLDLYCEILNSGATDLNLVAKVQMTSVNNHHSHGCTQDKGYVVWAFQILRDLPAMELHKLLDRWEMLTRGIAEIHEKVKELHSLTTLEENHSRRDLREESKKPTATTYRNDRTNKITIKEKVVSFLQSVFREYIHPIENIPLHEIIFFDNVDYLQAALIGDPRRRIQADLLESRKLLKCSCCSKSPGVLIPSMHDTSIMYTLAQEHGDLINVHEWFHSFKAIVSGAPSQAKKRSRMSPSPKKRKDSNIPQSRSDALIQAEFCRAVTELQITGLLRMPSKRRPDYVQRVAFGV
ncbi:hypothetical protein C2S51_034079 [Perilla frutescens var. frutescens]|nr:hypothetical protein C2S51_034079 [Perilla frutescens var. frutescens]